MPDHPNSPVNAASEPPLSAQVVAWPAPSPAGWGGRPRAPWAERVTAAAVAALAWGFLLLAWQLHPDPSGHGTHTQLGLPQCRFEALYGTPCPSCGMTTAFSAFVHGELAMAIRAQLLGTVLAACCLLAALGGTLVAAFGVSFKPALDGIFIRRTGWLYLLGLLALVSWALKVILDG